MTLDEQIDFANKRISAADQMGFGQATFPIEPLRAIMSELVRLREENRRLEHEADMEYVASLESDALGLAAERDALRARNAELEAFAERMKGAPGRLAVAMESAVMYANGEHQEGILEVVRVLRLSDLDAAIFGEGPLPWDEKGGVK